MGCCTKNGKKSKKKGGSQKKSAIKKVEKRTSSSKTKEKKIVPIKSVDKTDRNIPQEVTDQNHPLKTENSPLKSEHNLPQEATESPIATNIVQTSVPPESQVRSPSISSPNYDLDDFLTRISSSDNISPVTTLADLQKLVREHQRSVSIVLFYGRYCPYSKRTMPGLRRWARANGDRIFLYEADVQQALDLADFYHVRTIPTLMAFEEQNLLVPIWQRTATNVASTDLPLSENEIQPEQYLIVLDHDQTMPSKSKLVLAVPNKKNQVEYLKTIDRSQTEQSSQTKSITSSKQSPYMWSRSIRSTENESQQLSTEEITDYNGRLISQSVISTYPNTDQSKQKRTWSEYLEGDNSIPSDESQQQIHLPNRHEIHYEKQYPNSNEFDHSPASDRFSTLTTQHVKLANDHQEEICVLYLGPNRRRGFEENIPEEKNSSKLSLLTLKSNSTIE